MLPILWNQQRCGLVAGNTSSSAAQKPMAGASFALPASYAHYVWTTNEPPVLQLVASGPWGLTYIDPADESRKKK